MDIKSNNKPLLSIVIPTKNRFEYALKAIESCLRIQEDNYELIVEDNSSNNDLEEAISRIKDKKLRYIHNKESIDMSMNFENAVERANGEYITVIGDDDSVSSDIIKITQWCKANNVDAIVTSRPSDYVWPDCTSQKLGKLMTGKLLIKKYTSRIEYPNALLELKKCLRSGVSKYYKIPRLYYGIVNHTVLYNLKGKAGCYFPGPTPDMANAVALCFFVKNLAWIDYPLFLPGVGKKSGSGLGAQNKHTGKLREWNHLSKKYIDNWSAIVPKIFSGAAIWAEDAIQALNAIDKEGYKKHLNIASVYARCLIKNKDQKEEVMICLKDSKILLNIEIIFEMAKFTFQRIISLIRNIFIYKVHLFLSFKIIANVEDIYAASILHDKYTANLFLE
jgi:glycosyltransferase involved in cell wall biosynthesis